MVYPLSNRRSSEPDIAYRQVVKNALFNSTNSDTFVSIPEPFVRYEFIFSISSNREDEFFELFDKLKVQEFGTKSIYIDDKNTVYSSTEKVSDISFTESVVELRTSIKHKLKEKEYVRWSYKFAGKLGSIMAYVSYLEDTIEFFSRVWGYSEEGGEFCLLKFPIGSIISKVSDKSKDLVVLDYSYLKIGKEFYIDYVASEILSTGNIITYGRPNTLKESEICFSRNHRIDDILN